MSDSSTPSMKITMCHSELSEESLAGGSGGRDFSSRRALK